MASELPLVGKGSIRRCSYCQKDILHVVILCATCPNFPLCGSCFAAGVELAGHKRDHSYRVVQSVQDPIIAADWTTEEELLLLEGIDMYGFGNWKGVAEHVVSKTEKQCEGHYWGAYLMSPDAPLPLFLDDPRRVEGKVKVTSMVPPVPLELSPPKPPAAAVDGAGAAAASNGAAAGAPEPSSAPAVPGIWPLRQDFDVEPFNDAENVFADMEFKDDDHPAETELKFKLLEVYNRKLEERRQRKAFVFERNVLDIKKQLSRDRHRAKAEVATLEKLRPYARFQSHDDHVTMCRAVIKEINLRKRVRELQNYRQLGLKTFEEVTKYEVAVQKKQRTRG